LEFAAQYLYASNNSPEWDAYLQKHGFVETEEQPEKMEMLRER
jgi:hypothetical protein